MQNTDPGLQEVSLRCLMTVGSVAQALECLLVASCWQWEFERFQQEHLWDQSDHHRRLQDRRYYYC